MRRACECGACVCMGLVFVSCAMSALWAFVIIISLGGSLGVALEDPNRA